MVTSNKYITTVQQYGDTEDCTIEIPHRILKTLNWEEGDELAWHIKDNQITITKVKDTTMPEQELIHPHDIIREEIQEYLNSESEGKEYKDTKETND